MTDFPVLDAPRMYANNQLGRGIIDHFGMVEPCLDEIDLLGGDARRGRPLRAEPRRH